MDNCICDKDDWVINPILPICDKYVIGSEPFCDDCGHDGSCHSKPKRGRINPTEKIRAALKDADNKGKLGVVAAVTGISGGVAELRK